MAAEAIEEAKRNRFSCSFSPVVRPTLRYFGKILCSLCVRLWPEDKIDDKANREENWGAIYIYGKFNAKLFN